ncbi:MAG: hypothetical protein MUE40_00060 [Anaerolineae bacterium]|jgi:hypothetical protein|nr:hypothetical protein [Anaerolineae bacterium]
MGVSVRWLAAAPRIVQYDFEGLWTWPEYYAAVDRVRATLPASVEQFDVILNNRDWYIPPGALRQGTRLAACIDPGTRTVAIVGASPLYKMMGRMFGRAFPRQGGVFVYVDSLALAVPIIMQRRQPQPGEDV